MCEVFYVTFKNKCAVGNILKEIILVVSGLLPILLQLKHIWENTPKRSIYVNVGIDLSYSAQVG